MNIKELNNFLISKGVSKNRYYLHSIYGSANDDDKLSLIIKKGSLSIEYEIYYKERGERFVHAVFQDEGEACQFFLKKILGDDNT